MCVLKKNFSRVCLQNTGSAADSHDSCLVKVYIYIGIANYIYIFLEKTVCLFVFISEENISIRIYIYIFKAVNEGSLVHDSES